MFWAILGSQSPTFWLKRKEKTQQESSRGSLHTAKMALKKQSGTEQSKDVGFLNTVQQLLAAKGGGAASWIEVLAYTDFGIRSQTEE